MLAELSGEDGEAGELHSGNQENIDPATPQPQIHSNARHCAKCDATGKLLQALSLHLSSSTALLLQPNLCLASSPQTSLHH